MTTPRFQKSKKNLETVKEAPLLHRAYTRGMWDAIAQGDKYVFGYAPMELLSSMGVYLVQHSAYGSVLASKGLDGYYKQVMCDRGYFPSLQNYHSLPLGYAFDKNPEIAPDGGLPRPSAIISQLTIDVALSELYAREFDCPLFLLEDPDRQQSIPERWWDADTSWMDPHIVDLGVQELENCCRFLESVTGKPYREAQLREHLERADLMADLYMRAVDMSYGSGGPSLFSITDALSEVAVWETHFGEPWALEHARRFYEEVKTRAQNRQYVCTNERRRILWASSPLWFNLGFYNKWEESHGAVFMETSYLPRSARTIHHDRSDPLKALLMRRHMKYSGASPTAAVQLCLNNVRQYGIDGVIVPAEGATRPAAGLFYHVSQALERAGIPVLTLDYQPLNSALWDEDAMTDTVTRFIESIPPRTR